MIKPVHYRHPVRCAGALALCALLTLGSLVAQAATEWRHRPVVTWAKNNAPPFFVISGPGAGSGFGDQLQAFIEMELPQYRHNSEVIPLRRLNQFWRDGRPYCFATMIHEPVSRDSIYQLSQPLVYYRPHGIISRDDLTVAQPQSLAELLTRGSLRLGVISDRTFGPVLDALLAARSDPLQRYERSDSDGFDGLFAMLALGRIDFIIDYAFVFQYYQTQPTFQALKFTPIAEVQEAGIWGAVGCTNSTWGRATLEDINGAISRLLARADYREWLSAWHADPADTANYWRHWPTDSAANFDSAAPSTDAHD